MTALLLTITPLMASAVRVDSIYTAEIPVASHSENDKKEAIQAGLAQVFVKVSGNIRVMEKNPSLAESLKQADSVIRDTNYTNVLGDSNATLLSMRFVPEGVNKMLRDAGASVWTQSRPLILAWIVLETPSHPADIVDGSTPSELQKLLKRASKQRGLAVILPLMDVSELSEVSVDDVMKKSLPVLQKAAVRYDSNGLLIGSVSKQEENNFKSEWLFVSGTSQQSWNITGKSLEEIIKNVSNNMADTLAENYAVALTDIVKSQLVLKIQNVKEHTELIELMKSLQQLTPVIDVQLESVSNDEISLNVSLRGSKQAFIQAVSGDETLVSISSKQSDDDTLIYKLVH